MLHAKDSHGLYNYYSPATDYLFAMSRIEPEPPILLPQRKHDDIVERTDCFICCQPDDGQMIFARLPCLHEIHIDCLQSWMERANTCPMCRSPIYQSISDCLTTPLPRLISIDNQIYQVQYSNVHQNDISIVMQQTNASFANAFAAIQRHNGDIVNAILSLGTW